MWHITLFHTDGQISVARGEFPCPQSECGQVFQSVKLLKEHLKASGHRYPCDLCELTYSDLGGLAFHKQNVHTADEDKKHRCATCGKGFPDKTRLGEHENLHTGRKPFGCPFCEAAFRQRTNLCAHIKVIQDACES